MTQTLPKIIPVNELKNTALIMQTCKESNVPIVITRNGYGEAVMMSISLYEELFAKTRFRDAAKNVYDAFEFLNILKNKSEFKQPSALGVGSYIYHAPCHLRAQGFGMPALDILRDSGLNIEFANAGCCGISGNYGFRKENYKTSMAVAENLFSTIKMSGASTVISDCGTCREQIKHGIDLDLCGKAEYTLHPVQILEKLYNHA